MKSIFKRMLSFIVMMVMLVSRVPVFVFADETDGGVYTKLLSLKSKFPDGKYWNHVVPESESGQVKCYNDYYADYCTDSPCSSHNSNATTGQYDCNSFHGSIQCEGFAKKVFFDIFGELAGNTVDVSEIRVGDLIHLKGEKYDEDNGHWGVVQSINGTIVTMVNCNYDYAPCLIKWDETANIGSISECYRASNYDAVNNSPSILNIYIENRTASSYRIVCSVSDNVTNVKFPTWSAGDQSDLIEPDGIYDGNGVWHYDVELNKFTDSLSVLTHVYAYNAAGYYVSQAVDAELPEIKNIYITNKTDSGYRVVCTVTDNVDVTEVRFPTWSISDQSDIKWYTGNNVGNGDWYYDIRYSDFSNPSNINTHIYVYDSSKNQQYGFVEKEPPKIENIYVTNKTDSGYRVICTVSDNVSVEEVQFPTWSLNDQSDIKWYHGINAGNGDWYYDIKYADFSNPEDITTHIYAYDGAKNQSYAFVEKEPPKIENIYISNKTDSGYRVVCTVTDNVKVTEVRFPTWSMSDRSDIKWYTGNNVGNGDWYYDISYSEFNAPNDITTHIYAFDAIQNKTWGYVETNNPLISDVCISEKTNDGFRIVCSVTDDSGVSSVKLATWSLSDCSDLAWHDGDSDDNITWFCDINYSDYANSENIITDIYAYDKYMNCSSYRVTIGQYILEYYNGTELFNTQTKNSGEEITLISSIPSKDDCIFLGWADKENATEAQYQPGDMYTADEDITLYAVWKKCGDVNLDGYVNITDVYLLRKVAAGLATLNDEQKAVADVYADGRYNALDVNLLRRFIAEIVTEIPYSAK